MSYLRPNGELAAFRCERWKVRPSPVEEIESCTCCSHMLSVYDPFFLFHLFTGWWFQPLWKYESQLGVLFPIYGKKTSSKPPTSFYISKPISIDFINESQLLHRFNSPPPSTGSRKRRHRGSTAHGTRGRGWFDLARRTRGGKRLMVEVNMVCSNLKRYKYTLFFFQNFKSAIYRMV